MTKFRVSSSVVPCRRSRAAAGENFEVFLAKRSEKLPFFGGYWAFPGGKSEAGDDGVPLSTSAGFSDELRASLGCAVRELYEETGWLAATGSLPRGDLDGAELNRAELDGAPSATAFHEILARHGARVDAAAFRPLCRLETPRFSRLRFDTSFYLLQLASDARIEVRGSELVEGSWRRPAAVLDDWRRGQLLIAPPALAILDALATRPLDAAVDELRAIASDFEASDRAIPWGPGVALLPFVAPPLPPTLPANTFLVGGERFIVLDATPAERTDREHLAACIDRRLAAGDRLEAVVLTHHHQDHVGGLDDLLEQYSCPLWAHARTGELIERPLDRALDDGDTIDLGRSPDGRPDWQLETLFTPGHAQGHLAFFDSRYGALLAADLVSTLISMYVGSPGGHLDSYLQSVRRVRDLPVDILYPSHGPPSLRARELLESTLSHRAKRVDEVAELLGEDPLGVEELAATLYRFADARLRPLFERTTRATLEYLVEQGRARRVEEDVFVA